MTLRFRQIIVTLRMSTCLCLRLDLCCTSREKCAAWHASRRTSNTQHTCLSAWMLWWRIWVPQHHWYWVHAGFYLFVFSSYLVDIGASVGNSFVSCLSSRGHFKCVTMCNWEKGPRYSSVQEAEAEHPDTFCAVGPSSLTGSDDTRFLSDTEITHRLNWV